jgi:MoxR-like ATPase
MEAADVLAMQRAVEQVRVEDSLLDYALEIVEHTRQSERLTLGVSPRGSLMLQRAAQARAFIEGRDFCLPDDFKQLIVPVFSHRVAVNTRYATTQRKVAHAEAILREIVEATRVPL